MPTAHDTVDGVVPVTCSPPPGSPFPIGTTQVRCTAEDAHHNVAQRTFAVAVTHAAQPLPTLVLPSVGCCRGDRAWRRARGVLVTARGRRPRSSPPVSRAPARCSRSERQGRMLRHRCPRPPNCWCFSHHCAGLDAAGPAHPSRHRARGNVSHRSSCCVLGIGDRPRQRQRRGGVLPELRRDLPDHDDDRRVHGEGRPRPRRGPVLRRPRLRCPAAVDSACRRDRLGRRRVGDVGEVSAGDRGRSDRRRDAVSCLPSRARSSRSVRRRCAGDDGFRWNDGTRIIPCNVRI